jgi:hypothetical protein
MPAARTCRTCRVGDPWSLDPARGPSQPSPLKSTLPTGKSPRSRTHASETFFRAVPRPFPVEGFAIGARPTGPAYELHRKCIGTGGATAISSGGLETLPVMETLLCVLQHVLYPVRRRSRWAIAIWCFDSLVFPTLFLKQSIPGHRVIDIEI